MNKLAQLITQGEITVEELANTQELIERAKLVTAGIAACQKNITFPLGKSSIQCYSYTDRAGEYSAWGFCDIKGIFTCYCNWGGDHEIGCCNLNDFTDVFNKFDVESFRCDLTRFLRQQIEQANK